MKHDTNKRAIATRPVCGLLRCTSPQGHAGLCPSLGRRSQGEHGRVVRGSAYWQIQATALEMLHYRLPEEEGDIRCNVQGQDSASPLLQLYAWCLRENIYSGQLFVHQGTRNTLRNREGYELLQEGEFELATAMLWYAPRHKGLLHAHCQKEALGNCHTDHQKHGYAPYQQVFERDLGRRSRCELHLLADGSDSALGSKSELHHRWGSRELDRAGSCKEYAESGRWTWPTDWKSYFTAILECVPESVRPVCEARTEMQVLWPLCGRWADSEPRQRMAIESCAEDTNVPQGESGFGPTHGQAADKRGTQGHRVPWCIYQALQDIRIEKDFGAHREEANATEFQQAENGCEKRQLISRYLPAYSLLQYTSQAILQKRVLAHRSVRQRHVKDNRQETIL